MRTLIVTCCLLAAASSLAGVVPGDKAPDFTLTDTAGQTHSLAALLADGKTVVLEWFNPDCPFIVKHHKTHKTMDQTLAAVKDQGVVWLAVNSGAEGKQGAGLERNRKAVEDFAMTFPVLLDADGEVGKAYGALTSPHMFVIAKDGTVAYAGAIDDNRSADTLGQTNYVAEALAAVLAGQPVATAESKPYGCSVKYAD
ncbi:MAG: redoxin domain-containing protein [Krumholzibacteria bacterium]|nr:redoxin domain-containing protein [Candidatus Krumholzibacteria bacterium]